jgi:Chemoreceptor zinc-binding domain
MDLSEAMQKHAAWKIKFRQAISEKQTLDSETISKDNCCDFGKWLHGEAKSSYGKLPSYSACVSKHAAFHTEAGKVAKTINDKKYKEAEAMLELNTPYTLASGAVGNAITHLKKEAQL